MSTNSSDSPAAPNTDFRIFVGPNGTKPTRGTPGSAGFDLYAAQDYLVQPNTTGYAIGTDIKITKMPEGCYGRIAPRSGLAFKHHAHVLAGVIDPDYRGEVKVIITSPYQNFQILKGDRIAQFILERYSNEEITVISEEEIEASTRGAGGFGSTGK